ncbi:MAG: hypothetical protein EA406_14355 [Rhodospirillales bacterium]|nr:MAG: hypothetical protein EA406_14355 [Rhodospirillales bacterium]
MRNDLTMHRNDDRTGIMMPQFHWTEAMSVGVEPLDADHRCLVRIINLLRNVEASQRSAEHVHTVLDTLKLYGRHHFKREERIMQAARFPGMSIHRAEHQGFVRYLELLRKRYAGEGDPDMARELYDYLTGWLRHHVLIQDFAYKPYVSGVVDVNAIAQTAAPPLPNIAGLTLQVV